MESDNLAGSNTPTSRSGESRHVDNTTDHDNRKSASPVPKLEHESQASLNTIPSARISSLALHPGRGLFSAAENRARSLDDDVQMLDSSKEAEDTRPSSGTPREAFGNESDDELIEIQLESTPQEVRRSWEVNRNPLARESDGKLVKLKKEPGTEFEMRRFIKSAPLDSAADRALSSQRLMLKRNAGPSRYNDSPIQYPAESSKQASSSAPQAAASQSSSIFGPKSQTRNASEKVANESELIDKAMAPSGEDNAWMESHGDDELETLQALSHSLAQKHRSGTISQDEIVELNQIRDRIVVLKRLRSARNYDEQENELFVPEDDSTLRRYHRERLPYSKESDDASSQGSMEDWDPELQEILKDDFARRKGSSSSSKKPPRSRKKAPKDAREFVERAEEQRREKERKARQRKKKGKGKAVPSLPSRDKGKGKAKAGVPKLTRSMMREENDTARKMLADLLHNDAIADRVRNGYDPEPKITANTKKSQLDQLIASVPKNMDLRRKGQDKQEILRASKSFGYAKVKAVDGKWLPKGMLSSLYHHQLLGATFMLNRELSKNKPAGGINADAMGLGKTVEMLATMVGNPPTERDKRQGRKATLLVLPSAVISQWETEIRKHVKESVFPRILHYKASKKIPFITLCDQDIVLCSYAEVMNSFPYPDATALQRLGHGGLEKWLNEAHSMRGDLHKMRWYRIVLDEAHAIKNFKSRTALACQRLEGVYRWCLTGTPVLNRIEELYSYLRFLRIPYTNSYQEFVKWFCDPDARDCQSRIAAVLSFSMMRRNMNTKLLGHAIVSLPTPHPEIQYIDFSLEERIIYRITETRFRENINSYFARGTDQRNYGMFMVQLLRLRQCTSHPFMLEQTIKECWTAEDLALLRHKLKALGKSRAKDDRLYKRCKIWIDAAPADGDDGTETARFGRGKYGYEFKIGKFIKGTVGASREEFIDRVICSLCADVPRDPQITDCHHIFCKECLTGYMHEKVAQDEEYTECPTCQLVFTTTEPYTSNDITFPDDDIAEGSSQEGDHSQGSQRSRDQGLGRKGKDALGFEPSTKPSEWLAQSDGTKDMPLVPSAKTIALKAKILKWLDEAPCDKVSQKIVIFTQFRLLARIVGRIAEEEHWDYLYYTGDARDDHRTKVVKLFHSEPNIKILIAGLKCGGQGLNLTAANRCISLDLWWNHAVEQQAFGRTFRLGQDKETYFSRICVRNSVEMRILAMQADKLKIIERMMQDGEDVKNPPLDIKELASLFGYLNEDADGNLHVSADYVPDDFDEYDAAIDAAAATAEDDENQEKMQYEV
ncbi:SNF2 superfamily protein [Phlyctema vagabunda]|uniref:SNF2 superfamily protein n=1 Tax=Phlyctema vagabunda TaxID=108571 RepID=A0ABR4PKV0_9HELO